MATTPGAVPGAASSSTAPPTGGPVDAAATACAPLNPVACVPGVAGAAGDPSVVAPLGNPFAEAMREGAAWVMETTLGWWIDVPAVDVATSPAVTIRGWVLWLSLAVATVGVMWQGIVLMVSRRPDPLLGVGRGLFTLALWAAVGIVAPAAALRAGDAFAAWVLDQAGSGDAARRLMTLGSLTGVDSTGAVIVLGLLLIFAGIAQAVVMIFREGAVVVLAGVVVLAASGSMTAATRPWLPRVLAWMAALIAYKPVAALVYATAVAMIGEGTDPRTVLVGLTMMLLAIVALPALMKFFTWTTGDSGSGGGGGAAALGLAASGMHTAATLAGSRGAGASTGAQAASVRQDLGPAVTASPTAPPGAGPAGPAATGTAAAGTVATGAAMGGPPGAAVAGGVVLAQGAAAVVHRGATSAEQHLSGGEPS